MSRDEQRKYPKAFTGAGEWKPPQATPEPEMPRRVERWRVIFAIQVLTIASDIIRGDSEASGYEFNFDQIKIINAVKNIGIDLEDKDLEITAIGFVVDLDPTWESYVHEAGQKVMGILRGLSSLGNDSDLIETDLLSDVLDDLGERIYKAVLTGKITKDMISKNSPPAGSNWGYE